MYQFDFSNEQNKKRRVVVTGWGALSAMGEDVESIWQSMLAYQIGYQKVDWKNKNIVAKFFGILQKEPNLAAIPKALLKFLPTFGRYGMFAAEQAVNMAFGSRAKLLECCPPFERGVIFGTGWGAPDHCAIEIDSYQKTGWTSPMSSLLIMPSVATAAISMHWNLKGYQNTPIAACATGSLAIGDAYDRIRSGRATVMLAGGAESVKNDIAVGAIDMLRVLSREQSDPTRACCPFSKNRSGFIVSEGAAVLCLEEYEFARSRGANILGEIVGFASYSDATDMTASGIDITARVKTIRSAIIEAGIDPSMIGYINAHGTSTINNDLSETKTIKAAMGDYAYSVPISSTKSYTGHLIAAAGALESIFCLKTIASGLLPATIHLHEPDPDCDLDYIPNEHRVITAPEYVLNANYGFGGVNTALVFKRQLN